MKNMKRRHVFDSFLASILINGDTMKTKITLFLFALGLGSSIAYAMPPGGHGCITQCLKEYHSCIAKPGSNKAACTKEKNACIALCNEYR